MSRSVIKKTLLQAVWNFLFISKWTSVRHKVLERCTSAHGQPLFINFIYLLTSIQESNWGQSRKTWQNKEETHAIELTTFFNTV